MRRACRTTGFPPPQRGEGNESCSYKRKNGSLPVILPLLCEKAAQGKAPRRPSRIGGIKSGAYQKDAAPRALPIRLQTPCSRPSPSYRPKSPSLAMARRRGALLLLLQGSGASDGEPPFPLSPLSSLDSSRRAPPVSPGLRRTSGRHPPSINPLSDKARSAPLHREWDISHHRPPSASCR